MTEQPLVDYLQTAAAGRPERELLDGVFGPVRQLYKRLAQYSYFENASLYRRLARRPYEELVRTATSIAATLGQALHQHVGPHEVLVDAPPAELEVDFDIEVYFPKQNAYRRLGDVSPVVRTLAHEQFDDYVKRVRVFVHPRIAAVAQQLGDLDQLLASAIADSAL
jgi:hypothetical protein